MKATPYPTLSAKLTVRQQRAILRALIRGWWVVLHPKICFAVMLPSRFFTDEKIRTAIYFLRESGGDLQKMRASWNNEKFFAWAEKVKGGAL